MKRFVSLIAIVIALTAPTTALAAPFFPLVTCGASGQPPCTPCNLFQTAHNVLNFILLGVTGPIAAFLIVIAGGMMLLSGTSITTVANGRKLLTSTLGGVAIILLAWVVTNTLIKALGQGRVGDRWYEYTCPEFLQNTHEAVLADPVASRGSPQEPNAELVAEEKKLCTNTVELAKYFNVPSTVKNSPALDIAIACLVRDPVVRALISDNGVPRQLYTYENNNKLCNFTRGFSVCGSCAHTKNSCHYGGRTGTGGAEAADFNWNGKWVYYNSDTRTVACADRDSSKCAESVTGGAYAKIGGEMGLWQAIVEAAKQHNCQINQPIFENNHTHVSTTACEGR
jgi:hypothetical protein